VARSTRRDDRPGLEGAGGRVVLALVLGLALLAGGVYVAAYMAASDKVPVGTTVAGVDIGGKNPSGAMEALRSGLASRANTPFTVSVNGRTEQVPPTDVGLAVDYAASVYKAGAVRSWRLSHLWAYYTSGTAFEPVVTLDQDRLARLIQQLDLSVGRDPRNGSVVFAHQTFTVRPPRPGLVLDPRLAGTAFWNAYLTDDPTVQLRMSPVPPTIDAAAIQRFVRRFANPAMAAAVELHFGQASLHLSPAAYGDFLRARRFGSQLRPTVRAHALAKIAEQQLAGAAIDRPEPATVALVAGRPQVVSATPGVRYAPHDIAVALMRAITSRDRSARVRATPAKAAFTDADAAALGIQRRLASFTVPLQRGTGGDALASAVQHLDGTVLKPRQALSLRGLLGPTTPAGAGGDALATALFNSAWLGGLQVTAHATGRSYTGETPVGRDASLRHGQDLSFTDDTRYGVLVQVAASLATVTHDGSLTVTLWSTPQWTIRSTHGERTNVVAAGRDVRRDKGCTPSDGRDGFSVTVTRSFARGGAVDHTSTYTVRYAPVDAVVCKAPRHHRHD
jgi:vancomycin resistance protein YoaR